MRNHSTSWPATGPRREALLRSRPGAPTCSTRVGALAVAALVLGGAALGAPTPVEAQDTRARAAAEAAENLAPDRFARTTRASARSVVDNPALLPLTEDAEFAYTVSSSDVHASGHGLYATLPLFGFLGLGASAQFIADQLDDSMLRRYRLALGAGLEDIVAIGAAWDIYGSDTDSEVDDFSSAAFGITTRLIPGLALSMVVDNAATPRLAGRWLEPIWHFGAGTALLDGRLKGEVAYSTGGPLDDRIDATVSGTPIDGVDVFATVRADLDQQTRFGGGGELRFRNFGVHASAFGADSATDGLVFDGVTAGLSIRDRAARSVLDQRSSWVRYRLPASAPERAARSLFGGSGPSLAGILAYFDALARDTAVAGVVIDIEGAGYGFAQLYELRAALDALREAGIRVVVHLEDPTTRAWYLGSIADRLYVSPSTVVSLRGFATTATYYGGAFTLFGLEPQFVKIDEYKTAPDAWTRAAPTDEAREQLDAYLDAIFDEIVTRGSARRGIPEGQLKSLIDEAPLRPDEAVDFGLADAVLYADEVESDVESWLGEDISLDASWSPAQPLERAWTYQPMVAVIHIDGTISRGRSVEVPLLGGFTTGSRTISDILDWAGASPDVVGVVLRIDSPGGSAHGSDQMHRAIERFGERKPVVVSMGDIAASGGYFVAAPADTIYATPVTLTGSIGIFAGKFDFSSALWRVGISQYVFKRGAFADLWSTAVSWDDEARAQAFDQISYLYDEFIDRVARGRNIEPALARSVADGRVWAGTDAMDRGLVDRMGGLRAAIDDVARRSELSIDDVRIVHVPSRGPLSAFEVGVPIDLLEVLEPAEEVAPSPASRLVSELVGGVLGRGAIPVSMALNPGEPLMILPFDLVVTD